MRMRKYKKHDICQFSNKRTEGKEVILVRYAVDYVRKLGYLVTNFKVSVFVSFSFLFLSLVSGASYSDCSVYGNCLSVSSVSSSGGVSGVFDYNQTTPAISYTDSLIGDVSAGYWCTASGIPPVITCLQDPPVLSESDPVFLSWNLTFNQSNLNVNRSNFWDNLNTPADITLSDLASGLGSSKVFQLGGNTLTWQFTNPVGGMLFEWLGGASGHLLELNQNTGNPGPNTHLLHIQASDSDVVPFHAVGAGLLIANFTGGNILQKDNITASYYLGNGSLLSGIVSLQQLSNYYLNSNPAGYYNATNPPPTSGGATSSVVGNMIECEFIHNTATAQTPCLITAINSGVTAAILGEYNHPGLYNMTTSNTSLSGVQYGIGAVALLPLVLQKDNYATFIQRLNTLGTTSTNGTWSATGFVNSVTTINRGLYFNITQANETAFQVECVGRNASASNIARMINLSDYTWYKFKVYVTSNSTGLCEIYNNVGVLLDFDTVTNVPVLDTPLMAQSIVRTSGANWGSRNLGNFDYFAYGLNATFTR